MLLLCACTTSHAFETFEEWKAGCHKTFASIEEEENFIRDVFNPQKLENEAINAQNLGWTQTINCRLG